MKLAAMSAIAIGLMAQEVYKGPVPDKIDLPFIRHANKLIPTDAGKAREDNGKNGTTYSVDGAAAAARTPLTEPAFIIKVKELNVNEMQLYRMDTKGGQRTLTIPQAGKKGGPKVLRLSLEPLSTGLYKLEVQEPLENGEYCLSPGGSNAVYCFAVY